MRTLKVWEQLVILVCVLIAVLVIASIPNLIMGTHP